MKACSLLAAVLLVVAAPLRAAEPARRPNIVFILADDKCYSSSRECEKRTGNSDNIS